MAANGVNGTNGTNGSGKHYNEGTFLFTVSSLRSAPMSGFA